jgi:tetratricopeptide (TPR) repeat protein
MSRGEVVVIVVLAVLLVALLGGGGFLALRMVQNAPERNADLPWQPQGKIDANLAESAEFLPDQPLGPADEEERAILALLENLGQAIRHQDENRVGTSYDFVRLSREVAPALGLNKAGSLPEKWFTQGFRQGFIHGLTKNPGCSWGRTRIRQVQFLPNTSEAIVLARHWDEDSGRSLRARWWVRKSTAGWRVYDFEDLGMGQRLTLLLASLVGGNQLGPLGTATEEMRQATQAWLHGNLVEAKKTLEGMARFNLPQSLEGIRLMMLGRVDYDLGQGQEALKLFDQARGLKADFFYLDFLMALAHNQLGNHAQALDHARKYLDQMGEDAPAFHEAGVALLGLQRLPEAADAFRKGLDDDPASLDNLDGLRRALPTDQKTELGERFARLPQPEDHFEDLARTALRERDAEGLAALTEAMTRLQPNDPAPPYYRSRCQLLKGRDEEAVALFREALGKVTAEEQRREYLTGFLSAMHFAGKTLAAYRAAPDPDLAFRHLAGMIWKKDRVATLRDLIALHRRQRPDDVWLPYYQGMAYQFAGDFDHAEASFARGMAKNLDKETRERYRSSRVAARFEAGQGLRAYEEIGPRKATFDQLAWRFDNARDGKGLAALVAAHRRADQADKDLSFWEAEAYWLQEQYEKVVRILQEKCEEILENKARQWQFHDRLIRALIRLRRVPEAAEVWEALPEKMRNDLWIALIYAAQGDVDQTEEALKEVDPEDAYEDPDLGPLLRTEPFRALREKYPEPKSFEFVGPVKPVGNE